MTLTTLLCIISLFKQICIFVGQEVIEKISKDFSIETNLNMFYPIVAKCEYIYPILAHPDSWGPLFEQT
jgi:hypothetical protein